MLLKINLRFMPGFFTQNILIGIFNFFVNRIFVNIKQTKNKTLLILRAKMTLTWMKANEFPIYILRSKLQKTTI